MDALREQLQKPLIAGLIGAFLGLILGWFVIGWGIWPVEYVGAEPKDLLYQEQVAYLRTAIEAYGNTHDSAVAVERYNKLGENAERALTDVWSDPGQISRDVLQAFATVTLVQSEDVLPEAGAPAVEPAEQEKEGSFGSTLVVVICVIAALALIVFAGYFFLRGRKAAPVSFSPAMEAQQAAREAQHKDYVASGGEPPLTQFMASYKLGDDLFDDSFSIDSPSGEFLGECGVGISETIGVGEPKRVTAYEVWLFDKTDIQTVTKVLMSPHAFQDETTRQRLAAKGEPVLVEPGIETVLETESLTMVARVESLTYGEGALPEQSFFDRFILELSIWPKA